MVRQAATEAAAKQAQGGGAVCLFCADAALTTRSCLHPLHKVRASEQIQRREGKGERGSAYSSATTHRSDMGHKGPGGARCPWG
eukprot:3277410-Rhodomonas_salina.1